MVYEKGCYYHLFNRGCNKELIFRDNRDYQKLQKIIRESKLSEYLHMCAFSFMPNHYHFLVRQISEKPVTNWIRYIFNIYVKYFNKKYERKGTLFESKVKARYIDKLNYLVLITHYIHNNPKNEFNNKYSSMSFLRENTIIYMPFYKEFFDTIDNYLNQFNEYKNMKDNDEMVEKYLFD
ncbi:hypothetical protein D4R71_05040 [bacterium]|nr:MAG: hypothetical protein D4R71_05040 [bacterium]